MRSFVPLAAVLCAVALACGDGGDSSPSRTTATSATNVAPSPAASLSPIVTSDFRSPTPDLSAELSGTPCGPPLLGPSRNATGGPRLVVREAEVCIGQSVHVGVRKWPADQRLDLYVIPPSVDPDVPTAKIVEDYVRIGNTTTTNGLADFEFLLEKQYTTQGGDSIAVQSGQQLYVAAIAPGSNGARATFGPITVR